MADNQDFATKQDLAALEARLTGRMAELEDRVIERMRDMQTELLRGLEQFARGKFYSHAPAGSV